MSRMFFYSYAKPLLLGSVRKRITVGALQTRVHGTLRRCLLLSELIVRRGLACEPSSPRQGNQERFRRMLWYRTQPRVPHIFMFK